MMQVLQKLVGLALILACALVFTEFGAYGAVLQTASRVHTDMPTVPAATIRPSKTANGSISFSTLALSNAAM